LVLWISFGVCARSRSAHSFHLSVPTHPNNPPPPPTRTPSPPATQQLSLPLEPAPSFRQGFGRLNLTRAIPVTDIAAPGWRMQFVDLAALSEGESHKYCISVTGAVAVTLAWYDWPASPAAGVTLQNDLDLLVTPAAAKGLQLRGNGWHDNLNTVSWLWAVG